MAMFIYRFIRGLLLVPGFWNDAVFRVAARRASRFGWRLVVEAFGPSMDPRELNMLSIGPNCWNIRTIFWILPIVAMIPSKPPIWSRNGRKPRFSAFWAAGPGERSPRTWVLFKYGLGTELLLRAVGRFGYLSCMAYTRFLLFIVRSFLCFMLMIRSLLQYEKVRGSAWVTSTSQATLAGACRSVLGRPDGGCG